MFNSPCIVLHSTLAFIIPTIHHNTTSTSKIPIKFHLPTHGSSIMDGHHKQARQRLVNCVHHVLLSLFLCSCVVQIESTSHSSHTNQLWQRPLAVFICTVHDVYNLQLTYITDGNGLMACEGCARRGAEVVSPWEPGTTTLALRMSARHCGWPRPYLGVSA